MKDLLRKILMVILGSAIFALGFDLFLEPAGLNCGGVSGIAMLIDHVVDAPWVSVGLLTILINLPLFLCGYRKIGKYFFFTSLLGTFCNALFFDLFAGLPTPEVEPVLAVVFGGAMTGLGGGIVFLAGASTGGIDIVARLLKLKFRNLPIGKLIFIFDLITAVATGVVFRQVSNTLYSALALYLTCEVLDKVVYGADYAKVALIITEKYEEVSKAVSVRLDRGITLLHGQGYYKRRETYVLLCAVKRKQLAELKEVVNSVDPDAFVILQDAHQVLGDGFKRYDRNEL